MEQEREPITQTIVDDLERQHENRRGAAMVSGTALLDPEAPESILL